MDYTFACDDTLLNALASFVEGKADTATTEITSTFNEIDNFGEENWSGTGYENFNHGCHNYEGALNSVPEVVKCFAKAFTAAAGGVSQVQTAAQTMVDELSS